MDVCRLSMYSALVFALEIAISLGQNSSGLRCYACFDTGGDNRCEDFDTYKLAMDGEGNADVKKNCTAPFDEACIIETYAILGGTVSHIRDCSDNQRFSFTSSLNYNRSAYDRLFQLKLNNETACTWDGQNQVCLTKCAEDFCNGPVLEEVIVTAGGAGVANRHSISALFAVYVLLWIYWLSR